MTVAYGFGLEFLGVDMNTWQVTPAMSVGYPVAMSPTFSLVPFGQLGLVWTRATLDGGSLGSESDSDTNGLLGIGMAMLFNDMISVGPVVSIPLGADGADEVFGFTASFGIGR